MGPYHMAGCFGCQVHCRAKYKIPTGLMLEYMTKVQSILLRGLSVVNQTAGV